VINSGKKLISLKTVFFGETESKRKSLWQRKIFN
jgi:hypothetical protein